MAEIPMTADTSQAQQQWEFNSLRAYTETDIATYQKEAEVPFSVKSTLGAGLSGWVEEVCHVPSSRFYARKT